MTNAFRRFIAEPHRVSLCWLLWLPSLAIAQEAAGYGYTELPVSARAAALGGKVISVVEPELSVAEQNPALLCREMIGQATLSYTQYLGDIHMGYAAYAGSFLQEGCWSAGIKYVDYGDFAGYDEQGYSTGGFNVKDMSLQAALGYPVNDRLRIGATLRGLYTSYESYSAFALAVDAGLNYYHEASGNSLSLTLTGMGGQLSSLYEDRKTSLSTQLNIGWTRELRHVPFCLSITAERLFDWNHDYRSSDGTAHSYSNSELVLNHLIFGLEYTAHDNFWLATSYNYRHQRQFIGGGGFLRGMAFGGGVLYRKWTCEVAYASAHAGSGSFTLGLTYHFKD